MDIPSRKKDQKMVREEKEKIRFLLLEKGGFGGKVNGSFETGVDRDVKYVRRYLGWRLGVDWREVEVWCYGQKLSDARDLGYVFRMLWKGHQLTKMKPEEEQEIMVLHFCKKGGFEDEESKK